MTRRERAIRLAQTMHTLVNLPNSEEIIKAFLAGHLQGEEGYKNFVKLCNHYNITAPSGLSTDQMRLLWEDLCSNSLYDVLNNAESLNTADPPIW